MSNTYRNLKSYKKYKVVPFGTDRIELDDTIILIAPESPTHLSDIESAELVESYLNSPRREANDQELRKEIEYLKDHLDYTEVSVEDYGKILYDRGENWYVSKMALKSIIKRYSEVRILLSPYLDPKSVEEAERIFHFGLKEKPDE